VSLFELKAMTVTRPDGAALVDGAQLSVEPGQARGLVGESGSGKTLLALSSLGLLPRGLALTKGEVWFGGERVDANRLATLRGPKVAMVMQEPLSALDPVLTIGAQIAEVFEVNGASKAEAKRRAVALIEHVGIAAAEARFSSYPHQLSGGMRQRALIAAALACEPKVLIADEPTTALDVTVQAQILELLDQQRKQRGLALVLISHDLELVGHWCEQVSVLYAGAVVEEGPTAQVLERPRHPYTAALLAARPRLGQGGAPKPIRGVVPAPEKRPSGCRFRDRCERADKACEVEPELVDGVACVHPVS
jgi:oligopeptide/dipeptide ABC transporter ATP-binding protein